MAVTEEAFDVEAVIRSFLADPTRSSMELPQMTTGQRKHARTLAEEHPGLKCESFGLAEERRMHLFKVAVQQLAAKEQQGEGMDAAELEALIRDFAADPSRTLLDLPRLSTEQRKQARKLAEQFPNISCESFGLGADRRLHLFKEGRPELVGGHLPAPADAQGAATAGAASADAPPPAAALPAPAFSVKNTFIDDWAAGGAPEPIVFRSCPLRLPAGPRLGLSLGLDEAAHEGAAVTNPNREEDGSTSIACTADLSRAGDLSPGASTCASGGGCARTPSDRSSKAALPLPEGLQVRNTFLCGAEPFELADDRIVRSMPHGMFSQRLLEELLSDPGSPSAATVTPVCVQASAPAPPLATTPPPAPPAATQAPGTPEAQRALEPGTEVIIDGLTKLPDYNGLRGTVQAFDAQAGRYDVLLPVAVGPTSRRWAKVKRENLRVARPPQPPCFEPSVAATAGPPSLAREEPWEALGLQTWSTWEDLGSMLSPITTPMPAHT